MGWGDNYPTDHCSDKHQIWYFSETNLYSCQLYRQGLPSTLYRSQITKCHNSPLSLRSMIEDYNLLLGHNECLWIHYSSSLSDSLSKYDSMVFISLTRVSSTEIVMDLVDPK